MPLAGSARQNRLALHVEGSSLLPSSIPGRNVAGRWALLRRFAAPCGRMGKWAWGRRFPAPLGSVDRFAIAVMRRPVGVGNATLGVRGFALGRRRTARREVDAFESARTRLLSKRPYVPRDCTRRPLRKRPAFLREGARFRRRHGLPHARSARVPRGRCMLRRGRARPLRRTRLLASGRPFLRRRTRLLTSGRPFLRRRTRLLTSGRPRPLRRTHVLTSGRPRPLRRTHVLTSGRPRPLRRTHVLTSGRPFLRRRTCRLVKKPRRDSKRGRRAEPKAERDTALRDVPAWGVWGELHLVALPST